MQRIVMKHIVMSLIGCLIVALACGPAGAWSQRGSFWHRLRRGGGSWSASGFRGGWPRGGLLEGTGFRGGTASAGVARGAPTAPMAQLLITRQATARRPTARRPTGVPLLRWNLCGVPSAATVNYMAPRATTAGGWSTAGAAAAGAAVGMVAGAAVASANTAADVERLLCRLRCWRSHHRVCHGRDLCDAPGRLRRIHYRRYDLLPL